MNAISLAALLGAATWFGSKLAGRDSVPEGEDREAVPRAPDFDSDVIDLEDSVSEFVWPPGPLFQ